MNPPPAGEALDVFCSDYDRILALIPPQAHVLDLGCGEGQLLRRLTFDRGLHACGVELNEENVIRCVEQGLSAYQANIDDGLAEYPDGAFDFVILNQTLQVLTRPRDVMREMLRVGRYGIVSFPNFAHWRIRLSFLSRGRMPRSDVLPFSWYDTPNIHLCTMLDFFDLCAQDNIAVMHGEYLIGGRWRTGTLARRTANLLAASGLFVITRPEA